MLRKNGCYICVASIYLYYDTHSSARLQVLALSAVVPPVPGPTASVASVMEAEPSTVLRGTLKLGGKGTGKSITATGSATEAVGSATGSTVGSATGAASTVGSASGAMVGSGGLGDWSGGLGSRLGDRLGGHFSVSHMEKNVSTSTIFIVKSLLYLS